jgi:hypothetical protein
MPNPHSNSKHLGPKTSDSSKPAEASPAPQGGFKGASFGSTLGALQHFEWVTKRDLGREGGYWAATLGDKSAYIFAEKLYSSTFFQHLSPTLEALKRLMSHKPKQWLVLDELKMRWPEASQEPGAKPAWRHERSLATLELGYQRLLKERSYSKDEIALALAVRALAEKGVRYSQAKNPPYKDGYIIEAAREVENALSVWKRSDEKVPTIAASRVEKLVRGALKSAHNLEELAGNANRIFDAAVASASELQAVQIGLALRSSPANLLIRTERIFLSALTKEFGDVTAQAISAEHATKEQLLETLSIEWARKKLPELRVHVGASFTPQRKLPKKV